MCVHNSLIGTGLRDRVKIGASGKVANGSDIVKRIIQGADYTNAARAMMMAVGCIQAQRCHTNTCPVGVTTQDPKRARALDVGDKSLRVQRFQDATVRQASQLIASMGLAEPRPADAAVAATTHRPHDHEDVRRAVRLARAGRAPARSPELLGRRLGGGRSGPLLSGSTGGRLGTDPVRRHTHRAKETS